MRFKPRSACTPEILSDLATWKAQGVSVNAMRHALLTGRDLAVSGQTVRNWLAGKVPKPLLAQLGPEQVVPWGRPS